MEPLPPAAPASTASERVPCASCGAPVDVLRAPFVAVINERYRFYCSRPCRERGRPTPSPAAREERLTLTARPSLLDATDMLGLARASLPPAALAPPAPPVDPRAAELARATALSPPPPDPTTPALAVGAACMGALLGSLEGLPHLAQLALVAVPAVVGLTVAGREAFRSPKDGDLLGGIVGWAGALLALSGALRATGGGSVAAVRDAAVLAAIGPLTAWAARMRRAAGQARMEVFRDALPAEARAVRRGHEGFAIDPPTDTADTASLRAGVEVIVGAGEVIPVDGVTRAGEAEVRLWPGARESRQRVPGDAVLAGARVVKGTLRVLATRAGDAVAWARLARWMTAPREGPHTVRLARRLVLLAPAGVAATALAMALLHVFVLGGDPARAAGCVLALAPLVRMVTAVQAPFVEALVEAARRGIVFRDAASVEEAARVGTVALCFRGTVTVGRPELTEVVSLGSRSEREVLALAAAAEEAAASEDPLASAILRGAMSRGLRLEGVRRPVVLPGQGVTAVSASGDAVVVGQRRLLLAEGVSVAPAEDVLLGIEAAGRTAVLVAIDGRVEGVLGIDDPVRPEARSAVQALIDAGFEVALIAGTGRATVEAIGAMLDVSNLRPEVSPEERAGVVRALSEVGGGAAVVGRPRWDGAALAAADVGIQLEAAGGVGGETAIALASDDLRDAAAALTEARRAKERATAVLAMGVAGTVAGVFVAAALPSWGVLAVVAATVATLGGEALVLRARMGGA
ncbi:MAG: cation-translocating P-type ATPase [Deltaproteobacteria bacterium]|nr:cation-translocating P-type ATPase [Deltaproteobacteria bacterium]